MSRRERLMPLQGDRLKKKRDEMNLSQEELAELAGTTRRQISRYEHGRSEPGAAILARLAMTLGCSADYLLALSDEQTGHGPKVDAPTLALAIRLMKLGEKKRAAIIGAINSFEQLS